MPTFSSEVFKSDEVYREFGEERHRLEVEAANERLEKFAATSGRRLTGVDGSMAMGVSARGTGEFSFFVILEALMLAFFLGYRMF